MSRWDSAEALIGARLATREERKAGAPGVIWDTQRIVPLTAEFCRKYHRELTRALALGDLKERTAEDYAAYTASREEAKKKRREEAEKRAKTEAEAKAKAEAAAKAGEAPPETKSESGDGEGEPPAAPPQDPKPAKGRK